MRYSRLLPCIAYRKLIESVATENSSAHLPSPAGCPAHWFHDRYHRHPRYRCPAPGPSDYRNPEAALPLPTAPFEQNPVPTIAAGEAPSARLTISRPAPPVLFPIALRTKTASTGQSSSASGFQTDRKNCAAIEQN